MTWTNPPPLPSPDEKPRRRVFLWVFLTIQALFLAWVLFGVGARAGDPPYCDGLEADFCNSAETVGTTLGVVLMIFLWLAVDVILGISYLIYRVASRK